MYYCQGILYSSDSSVSKFIAMLILCMSIVYAIKYILCSRIIGYVRALLVILSMVSVYGVIAYTVEGSIIHGMVNDTKLFLWFRNMYLSILPVFTYLYFAKSGKMSVCFVRNMFPVIILAVLCSYYWSYLTAIQQAFIKTGNDVNETTNNAGYTVLTLVPMLLIYEKKKILQYIGLLVILTFVVLSVKRGAILVCGVMSFLFVIRSLRNTSGKKKVLVLFLIFSVSLIFYYFMMDYMSESDYLLKRIEETKEGRSSGRNDIYMTLWRNFENQTESIKTLFGGGVWYTTKLTWTAAHNDWLEILIDMGIFGVLVYVYYWIAFFRFSLNKNMPELSRFCVFLIAINLFMKTIFSMSLDSMTFTQGMMIGLSYYGLLNSNT